MREYIFSDSHPSSHSTYRSRSTWTATPLPPMTEISPADFLGSRNSPVQPKTATKVKPELKLREHSSLPLHFRATKVKPKITLREYSLIRPNDKPVFLKPTDGTVGTGRTGLAQMTQNLRTRNTHPKQND